MPDNPSISQRAQGSYIAQATNNGTATVNVGLSLTPQQEQNRVRFLKRLRCQYDQIWEQSLQGMALLTLGLHERPNAVRYRSRLLFRTPHQPEQPLSEGTTIERAFDRAGQELLILGGPGAGKSELLLELARHLVQRAEQDEQVPMPVIIPLSSWAVKRLPLVDWLRDQLALLYDVPRHLSTEWLKKNLVLPLLDGLDEVPRGARVACIEAINAYHKEPLVPLVVCSRRVEYEEIDHQHRLVLSGAVVVQPLTREQISAYLNQAGSALDRVRTAWQTNPVLRELITTPLMLSVVALTFAGTSGRAIPRQGTPEEQQRMIFAAYIERMVTHKGDVTHYPLQRTEKWLSWLARKMRQHHQTVFSLEQLQPDWLSKKRQTLYQWSVRVVGGLIGGGLVGILAYALLIALGYKDNAQEVGLYWGLIPALLGGLLWGKTYTKSSMNFRSWLAEGWRSIFISPMFSMLVYVGHTRLSNSDSNPILHLLLLLVIAVVSGLSGGLIATQVCGDEEDMRIELTEVLTWSWRKLGSGLVRELVHGSLLGLLLGVDVGLIFMLAFMLWGSSDFHLTWLNVLLSAVIFLGLSGMLLGMFFGALFGGFSGEQLSDRLSLSPNEGLWRSAKHGLLVGIISALAFAIVSVPIGLLARHWGSDILGMLAIISFLFGFLLGALVGGLAAVIRHYILRFWLCNTAMFPLHTIRFLNDATTRILLQRVGNGYSFAHQLIFDYFVSLENSATSLEDSPIFSTVSLHICDTCGYHVTCPARYCPQCGNYLLRMKVSA